MYTVIIRASAKKMLRKIPREYRERIESGMRNLATDPFRDSKKLEGKYEGMRSMRIWPYRIVFTIKKDVLVVLVLFIGHRQGVYK